MSEAEEVGFVREKKCEETEIEWIIPDIFEVPGNKTDIYCPIFSFANTQWRLQLSLQPTSLRRIMRLYLRKIEICAEICGVEYDIGLKKTDGSIESVTGKRMGCAAGLMFGSEIQSSASCIRLSKIERQKSEFAPLNILIIVCKLKREATISDEDEPRILDSRLNTIIKTDLLSQNLKDLFSNKESCDTVLLVKGKEFKVHRALLIARSSVFAAMFRHDTTEKLTGNVIIDDCDPDSFQLFLEYLYCGKLEYISSNIVLNLYKISDKYNIPELKLFCTKYLDLNLTVQNICEVVSFADEYNDEKLMSSAEYFFNVNVKEILATNEWENLMKRDFNLANKLLIGMVKDKEMDLEIAKCNKKIRF